MQAGYYEKKERSYMLDVNNCADIVPWSMAEKFRLKWKKNIKKINSNGLFTRLNISNFFSALKYQPRFLVSLIRKNPVETGSLRSES